MKKIQDFDKIVKNLDKRHMAYDLEHMQKVVGQYFKEKIELEALRKERNDISKFYGGEAQREIAKDIKNKLKEKEENFLRISDEYEQMLMSLPNLLHESVPEGRDSQENIVVHTKGEITFHKHHYDMPIFNDVSESCGSRFVSLRGQIAQLERALVSYALDRLNALGFEEHSFPYMLNTEALKFTGHYRELSDMFVTTNDKALIPTGELPLLLLARNRKLCKSPYSICTVTDCFRKEAGAAGKDTKGLIRVHQFKKVEMVIFCNPEDSYHQLEKFTRYTEELLESLEIPYRRLLLCSGDTGFRATKTYDIEIPIGNQWRECASMSNCEEYQTALLRTKYVDKYAHALNGTYIAAGRVLASLLEINYSDGIIRVPLALHKYVSFTEIDLNAIE